MIALAIKGVLLRYVANTVSVPFYSNSFRQIKASEIWLRPKKFTKIFCSGNIQTLTDNFYFLLQENVHILEGQRLSLATFSWSQIVVFLLLIQLTEPMSDYN